MERSKEPAYDLFMFETLCRFEKFLMFVKRYGPSIEEIDRLSLKPSLD